MRIILLLIPAFLIGLASCKKCHECSKENRITANGVDSIEVVKFEICNKGAENNGLNHKSAVADYEANGYTCVEK